MSLPELERMLSAMLPCAGATAVTLTQLPEAYARDRFPTPSARYVGLYISPDKSRRRL